MDGSRRRQNGGVSAYESNPGSTKGRLLVATPPLADPNFDRTVVFVLEHTDDGAVGVVLNRPTPFPLPDGVARWEDLLTTPATLFEGGPVELDALIALARVEPGTASAIARAAADDDRLDDAEDEDDEGWSAVVGDIGSVDLSTDPALVRVPIHGLRVFRGYSGWGPQQLDGELAEGAWMVLPAEDGDVFSTEPDELWRTVIRRQGGRLAWVANAPDDLSLN